MYVVLISGSISKVTLPCLAVFEAQLNAIISARTASVVCVTYTFLRNDIMRQGMAEQSVCIIMP